MAMRYPGGLIATSPVNAAYPSGVWTQSQTIPYASQNVWQQDQYWRNTTLLLHGDGTNGAQNNTFLDSGTANSGSGFTITRNGNTTQGSFTPFQQNGYWSNYFDGSGDYCLTSSTQVIPTGSFTVEAWVYPLGTGNSAIVAQGTSGDSGRFSLGFESGLWFLQIGNSTVNTGTPASNQWIYVAATFNGSTLTLYVNGTSIGTVSTSNNAQNTTLRIGTLGPSDWANYYWNGYISNLRISNTVRTVTSIPTSPFTNDGNTTFLSCQSNRFVDNSTTPKTLTIYGNTAVQAFQPFPGPTTWSASVLGGSGYFDGTGDWLNLNNSGCYPSGTQDTTVELWWYPTSIPSVPIFLNNETTGAFGLYYESGALKVDSRNSSTILSASYTFTAGQWYHIAYSRSGNTHNLYVNGTRIGTGSNSVSFATAGNPQNIMAQPASSRYTPGYATDVRVVLGTALYTGSTLTVPTAPLTAVSNTALLMSMTNGGIIDNAQMNDLETVGNAQISTSVVKYGTGSMAFDGSGDYLVGRTTDLLSFNTGDFTVEMWVYPNSVAGNIVLIDTRSSGTDSGWAFYINSSSKLALFTSNADRITAGSALSASTWTHVVLARSGSTLAIYMNGVQSATATYSTTMTCPGRISVASGFDNAAPLNGYIDDLRITKGVARYISNFTPPIARMPNQ